MVTPEQLRAFAQRNRFAIHAIILGVALASSLAFADAPAKSSADDGICRVFRTDSSSFRGQLLNTPGNGFCLQSAKDISAKGPNAPCLDFESVKWNPDMLTRKSTESWLEVDKSSRDDQYQEPVYIFTPRYPGDRRDPLVAYAFSGKSCNQLVDRVIKTYSGDKVADFRLAIKLALESGDVSEQKL